MKTLTGISLIPLFAILFASQVIAEPGHGAEMKCMHHESPTEHSLGHGMKHKKSDKKDMHMFTPIWAKTLSDEQKLAIDKMHLDVAKKQKIISAKMKVAKAELNLLAIAENADMKKISTKIDEVTGLIAEKMKVRFEHIVEMRKALTAEQRISYDMSILSRDKKSKGKHH